MVFILVILCVLNIFIFIRGGINSNSGYKIIDFLILSIFVKNDLKNLSVNIVINSCIFMFLLFVFINLILCLL